MDRQIGVCLLFLALFGAGIDAACQTQDDPCANYIELDDPTRSTGFVGDSSYVSDYDLDENWYRSISGAGGDMPTEPVFIGQCNAYAPIWLNGDLPDVGDGITDVDGCAAFLEDDCIRQYVVPVKNCGNYRVYCLAPVDDTFDRYCIGSETECPAGSASATGYTPCGDLGAVDLELTEDPAIHYDVDYVQQATGTELGDFCTPYHLFTCDITHDNHGIFFDVTWFANGDLFQEHTGRDAIAYRDMPHTITSTELLTEGYKIGTTLTCRTAARARNRNNALVGSARETSFYVGMEVADENLFIEIEEGGPPAFYNATFTIPYKCSMFCDRRGIDACELDILIINPDPNAGSCASDVVLEVQTSYERGSCTTIADEFGFSLKVHANTDDGYDPGKLMVLQLTTPTIGNAPFWSEYRLPRAQVFVSDTARQMLSGRSCVISDDPHLTTFDGHYFDVQLTGIFVLYKHKTLPILVEVYFSALLRDRYTANCGGAVRAGGEVFVFDACRANEPIFVTNYECNEGLQNMIVRRIHSTQYEVTLSTGTKVLLGLGYQKVYPSVFDFDQTEGLCGNFNGINTDTDDRIIRNSNPLRADTVTYTNYLGRNWLNYHAFSNSWRIEEEDSLYYGVVTDDLDFNDIVFCTCVDTAEEDAVPGASCSPAPHVRFCVDGAHNEASGNFHRCTLSRRRKRRDVSGSDTDEPRRSMFAFDPDLIAEPAGWINGWTEESAIEYCENYFSQNSVSACDDIPNVNRQGSVDECQQDIYITGSSEHSDVHVNSYTESCQAEASRYVFESTSNITLNISAAIANLVVAQTCPSGCSHRGTCEEGRCVCDEEYTSSDCSIEINHRPQLFDLANNGTCDLSTLPCEIISVYADQYTEDSVYCRLRIRDIHGNSLSDETIIQAEYMHVQRVLCIIDPVEILEQTAVITEPYYVEIAVANGRDGEYSLTTQALVYNAICWDCDRDGNCVNVANQCSDNDACYSDGESNSDRPCQLCDGSTGSWYLQDNDCLIGNSCYEDGDENPNNSEQVCDVSNNANSWTDVSEKMNPDGSDTTIIIIIVCCVVVVVIGIVVAVVVYFKCVKKTKEIPEKYNEYDNNLAEIIDEVKPPTDHKEYSTQALTERYSGRKFGLANVATSASTTPNPNPQIDVPIAQAPMTNRPSRSTSNVSNAKTARGKPMQWTSRPQSAASNRSGSALGSRTSLNAAPFSRHGVDPASRAQTPGGIDLGFGL